MCKVTKILIVDDDIDFVAAISDILKSNSYNVDIAYNMKTAIEKLETAKPDLVILDLMLDRLTDGFTICYKMKHDPKLKDIPVFALSAVTKKTGFKFSPKTDGEYFEADDYAEKPINPGDLLQRIEKLLNR